MNDETPTPEPESQISQQELDQSREGQLKVARELIDYANANYVITSLLYDLDLMPEQVDDFSREWYRMLNVIGHFKQAIENPIEEEE
jgi:hypothetical protein